MRYLLLLTLLPLFAGCATLVNPFQTGYELSFYESALPPNARTMHTQGSPVVIIEEEGATYGLMPHRRHGFPAVGVVAINRGNDSLEVDPASINVYLGSDTDEANALRRLTREQYQREVGGSYGGQRNNAALVSLGGAPGTQTDIQRVRAQDAARSISNDISRNKAADVAAAADGHLLRTNVPPGATYKGIVVFKSRGQQGSPMLFLVFTSPERTYTLPMQYRTVGR